MQDFVHQQYGRRGLGCRTWGVGWKYLAALWKYLGYSEGLCYNSTTIYHKTLFWAFRPLSHGSGPCTMSTHPVPTSAGAGQLLHTNRVCPMRRRICWASTSRSARGTFVSDRRRHSPGSVSGFLMVQSRVVRPLLQWWQTSCQQQQQRNSLNPKPNNHRLENGTIQVGVTDQKSRFAKVAVLNLVYCKNYLDMLESWMSTPKTPWRREKRKHR